MSGASILVYAERVGGNLGEIEKLVRAKGVAFQTVPPVILAHRAFIARTNAIAPMIFIGKATARPAYQRHVHGFEGAHHVVTPAFGIRDLGLRADPQAAVLAGADRTDPRWVDAPLEGPPAPRR